MNIQVIAGVLTAKAESVADMRVLLALKSPVRATGTAKKAEYKKACPVCSKRVKYMQAHTKKMHNSIVPITRIPNG